MLLVVVVVFFFFLPFVGAVVAAADGRHGQGAKEGGGWWCSFNAFAGLRQPEWSTAAVANKGPTVGGGPRNSIAHSCSNNTDVDNTLGSCKCVIFITTILAIKSNWPISYFAGKGEARFGGRVDWQKRRDEGRSQETCTRFTSFTFHYHHHQQQQQMSRPMELPVDKHQ